MASPLKSLVHDDDGYDKSFTAIGDGKSINIIGLGTGEGNFDMEILSQLRVKHPGVLLDNEVVEPSTLRILRYKERAAQMFHLDPVNFTWNQMTASEFEEQWRQRNITKKVDFIHMLHMLYYVEDPGATLRFYQSLLRKNGKILISLVSVWRCGQTRLCKVLHNPPPPSSCCYGNAPWVEVAPSKLLCAKVTPSELCQWKQGFGL
ncbi:histamine N-methyltransferase-like [Boleophthalmus pectinirostris]|uniref:histamine N-methyltransferase-like n=1 Tax=Boleophthalmus pectinirostris TaxID=150288 RepID=UPI00242E7D96|nr:histamine N-methyltransferase-like [Boleophthalmus pectinirostris]